LGQDVSTYMAEQFLLRKRKQMICLQIEEFGKPLITFIDPKSKNAISLNTTKYIPQVYNLNTSNKPREYKGLIRDSGIFEKEVIFPDDDDDEKISDIIKEVEQEEKEVFFSDDEEDSILKHVFPNGEKLQSMVPKLPKPIVKVKLQKVEPIKIIKDMVVIDMPDDDSPKIDFSDIE